MKKSLEAIVSKAKSLLGATALVTPMALGPITNTPSQDTSTYNYLTIELTGTRNQNPKTRLYQKTESSKIQDEGNYQTPSTDHQEWSSAIGVQINHTPGEIEFSYKILQGELPQGQKRAEESSVRSSVYLVSPKNVDIGISQRVTAWDYENQGEISLYAISGENKPLMEKFAKFNELFSGVNAISPQNLSRTQGQEKNELEKAFDNGASLLPGATGQVLTGVRKGVTALAKFQEKKNVDSLQEKFGDEYDVQRLTLNAPNGTLSEVLFKRAILERKFHLVYDIEDMPENSKVHIVISDLTFSRRDKGFERLSTINGLEYAVDVEGSKAGESYRKEDLYGKWTSIEKGKSGFLRTELTINKDLIFESPKAKWNMPRVNFWRNLPKGRIAAHWNDGDTEEIVKYYDIFNKEIIVQYTNKKSGNMGWNSDHKIFIKDKDNFKGVNSVKELSPLIGTWEGIEKLGKVTNTVNVNFNESRIEIKENFSKGMEGISNTYVMDYRDIASNDKDTFLFFGEVIKDRVKNRGDFGLVATLEEDGKILFSSNMIAHSGGSAKRKFTRKNN